MMLCIEGEKNMIQTYRTAILFVLLTAALALSACGGSSGATIADVVEQASSQAAGENASAAGSLNPAKATVTARSLRVRGEPDAAGTVVGGIKEGEVYDVIGLSSDGEWVQLAIPAITGGSGWVSANFVEVQGSITEATVTTVTPASGGASASRPTPTPGSLNLIAAAPGTATVQTEGVRLRVRAEPSANAEIVGYVYDGEIYAVVETSADGQWTQLGGRPGTDNVNGGWVASEFLVLN
jgi:uncharacterized protein YgiM (DUF1202 family)